MCESSRNDKIFFPCVMITLLICRFTQTELINQLTLINHVRFHVDSLSFESRKKMKMTGKLKTKENEEAADRLLMSSSMASTQIL